jgi:hypothetical protein
MVGDQQELSRWLHGEMYHVGIVVPDFETGKAMYGPLVGHSWSDQAGGPQPCVVDGVRTTLDFGFMFSRGNGVRIELVRQIPGTIWTTGAGVHHLGFWSDDVAAESSALTQGGCPLTVAIHMDDAEPPIATYHHGFGGVYIELVSTSVREYLESLWR